jgi:hypothetical protein
LIGTGAGLMLACQISPFFLPRFSRVQTVKRSVFARISEKVINADVLNLTGLKCVTYNSLIYSMLENAKNVFVTDNYLTYWKLAINKK